MKFLHMLWLVLIAVAAVYIVICLYIYFAQGSLIYFPTRDLAVNPDSFNLSYEDVFIRVSANDSIHAWYSPVQQDSPADKTVLFCPGNAGNISYRVATILFLQQRGANVLIFDYRGYGRSTGQPSENNTYEDAQVAYNWLINEKNINASDVIIFGRSLGGAIAVDLASKVSCGGLIVESSFTSSKEMADEYYPLFPVRLLLRYHYDSLSKIKKVKCPILFTHSPEDELIPYQKGRRLYEAAPEPKSFYDLKGGHNQRANFDDDGYQNAVRDLIYGQRP